MSSRSTAAFISAAHKNVYIAVNKPLGYITSMEDDRERATVADLVTDIPERLFPVGRLDYNTTGLLIMTNDGQLTYTLTHPKHEVCETHVARVEGCDLGFQTCSGCAAWTSGAL